MRKIHTFFLLCFALGASAQVPGGVNGGELWFKTAPVTSDLEGYYRWQDFSGDSVRLMLVDNRGAKSELTLPKSSVHYFNFNPSLYLADGFRSLSAQLKHNNLSQATVIGVFAPELASIGKDMVLYALDGRKDDGAILSKDKAIRGTGVEPLDYGSTSGEDLLYQSSDSLSENDFKESALRVVSYFKVNNPSTSLWGEGSNATVLLGTPYSAGNMDTDYTTSLFGNNSIRGYAPELIVFGRMLTPDERRKVESYLAVKYGITLKGSYLDSGGNLIWDSEENKAYHHRVTAIGNDFVGSPHNRFPQPRMKKLLRMQPCRRTIPTRTPTLTTFHPHPVCLSWGVNTAIQHPTEDTRFGAMMTHHLQPAHPRPTPCGTS